LVSLITPAIIGILVSRCDLQWQDFYLLLSGEILVSGSVALLACLLSVPGILLCMDLPKSKKKVFYMLVVLPLLVPWTYSSWITIKALSDFGIKDIRAFQVIFAAFNYAPIPFLIFQIGYYRKRPALSNMLMTLLLAGAIRLCVFPCLLPEWSNAYSVNIDCAEPIPTISLALMVGGTKNREATLCYQVLYICMTAPVWVFTMAYVRHGYKATSVACQVPKVVRSICGMICFGLSVISLCLLVWELWSYVIPCFKFYFNDIGQILKNMLPSLACSVWCGMVGGVVFSISRQIVRRLPEKVKYWRHLAAIFSPYTLIFILLDKGILRENTIASLLVSVACITVFLTLFCVPHNGDTIGAADLFLVMIFIGFLVVTPSILCLPQNASNTVSVQYMFFSYVHPQYMQLGFNDKKEMCTVSATMLLTMLPPIFLGEMAFMKYSKKLMEG